MDHHPMEWAILAVFGLCIVTLVVIMVKGLWHILVG